MYTVQRIVSYFCFTVGILCGFTTDYSGTAALVAFAIYFKLASWETKKEMDEEKAKQDKVLNG